MVVPVKPNHILKQILKDLESNGGIRKADFKDICERKKGFYGVSGSNTRRNYQTAVDRLKRRYSAAQYKAICVENGVLPCAQTCEDVMDELKQRMEK